MSELRRAAIVYNPVKVDLEAVKAAVARAQEAAGWDETLWFETSVEDPGAGQTREALEQGVDMVIAAGGDGTVRVVAEALQDSKASLALLPSGTGNLLARNLNLTLDDVDNALTVAFSGEDRAIDIGVIDIETSKGRDRRSYVVMAGLGIDAKMLANTDDDLKKRAGWLAYVDALRKALLDKNQLEFRYSLNGAKTRKVRAHTIIVGNCGALPANILLLPDAAVDDGEFDIVLLRPEGFFGWVQIIFKVVWENGVLRRSGVVGTKLMGLTKEVSALRYVKGHELVVRLEKPQEIELDGDPFGTTSAFRTWIEPGGLTVRVPAA
ncbi:MULTISPECIES: diacylglycerol kinase family protein [unclassified Rathayibacter]|uniref:diacylglycerol/lipid kinase family protein n=1 Tax=unclassified Rathayibacter TaxID=2609250 RepID=UPI000F48168F|nr:MULTISPECIES: diacylglycerol kinase family protein [unclassified Rathayibacter]MCJ1674853.1 NAD(+)/NADH kinase [Rathayibacter sp. VKM Ac-2929]MCJ1683696.1 NAD(+)/NADH kinase [Rathayibacter sp. VKM Ac-2928]MCJ1686430.1 NAD(+)/NADH kinase [Rathayibacter sp. VKM Ac-2927]ROQ15638.1 diacylglycerol kinase family enzyme [Rathayibacter sp. PhB93]ROQ50569.1 diacylglycerol kinase family enzyme [Rathayibacter sp. PhB152]